MMAICPALIERVPLVRLASLGEKGSRKMQKEAKQLLHKAAAARPGVELCALYTPGLVHLKTIQGERPFSVDIPILDLPHIVLHNHPDNEGFSLADFTVFMSNPGILVLGAVGNGAAVYYLERRCANESGARQYAFNYIQRNAFAGEGFTLHQLLEGLLPFGISYYRCTAAGDAGTYTPASHT